jgi:cytochrome P450
VGISAARGCGTIDVDSLHHISLVVFGGQRVSKARCICLQDVREGKRQLARFHKCILELLEDLKTRRSEVDPRTIAGHLLRITDPKTGKPLTDDELAAEIGIFFFAGWDITCLIAPCFLEFLASLQPV